MVCRLCPHGGGRWLAWLYPLLAGRSSSTHAATQCPSPVIGICRMQVEPCRHSLAGPETGPITGPLTVSRELRKPGIARRSAADPW
jgi:hypothetical protein